MDTTVNVDGRQVAFRLNDDALPTPRAAHEAGTLIVGALLHAMHLPVTTVIKAVVATVTRTGLEILVETAVMVQGARVTLHRDKLCITARLISDYLVRLSHDTAWDPEVKQILRQALIQELHSEMRRLARPRSSAW